MPPASDKVDFTDHVVADPDAGAALDKLMAETGASPDAAPKDAPPPTADKPVADAAPAADKPVEAPPAADKGADEFPVVEPTDELSGSRVEALTDAVVEEPPAVESDPILKLIAESKLRDSASLKSKESYENLKRLSAESIKLAHAEKQKLKDEYEAKLAEALKKTAPAAVPAEVQEELESLRGFRATFDIENDPAFKKEVAARIEPRKAANYEAVYGVLSSHGLPESELKALKELPEADRVSSIADLVDKLPRASKLKVEAKLFDNVNLDDERQRAIAEAREKATKVRQEYRAATPEKAREQTVAEVKQAAETFKTHGVFKRAEVTPQTPPEERKRLEAQNADADKLQKLFDEAVADDSPKGRAENAFGLVLAHHFKAKADADAAKVVKLQAELDAIKKRGGMNDVGRVTNSPSKIPATTSLDAGESLDALARAAGIAA